MTNEDASAPMLSVTDVVALTRSLLEEAIPEILFKGEIGEVRSGKTGHVYFTVKDETSQVAAVMWASVAVRMRIRLVAGMAVTIAAHPTVYAARGSLQYVVHRIAEAGEGTLQKKFLELKAKLEREGLFAASRKRPLPFLPSAIGVVTSANGAVIHDIMHRAAERFPSVPIFLIDVRVQGEGSAEEVARAIEQFNRLAHAGDLVVDAIIVGRGGGSLEDLWAFNEERVVRAVYASEIPVVSAVGHETDVTLCDLVADYRAPTPTAAAEILLPRRDELLVRVNNLGARLLDAERVLAPLQQRLDEIEMRLDRGISVIVERAVSVIRFSEQRLKALQPHILLQQIRQRVTQAGIRLQRSGHAMIERVTLELARHEARLAAMNPRAVLRRGYAVVKIGTSAVRAASEVKSGDELEILLGTGEIEAIAK